MGGGFGETVDGAKTCSVIDHEAGRESAGVLARKASKPAAARQCRNGRAGCYHQLRPDHVESPELGLESLP